jgi:prevent-host-death family protein
VGQMCCSAHMTTVASRDLRNHTADVLRQVRDGTSVTITVNGDAVAEIRPIRAGRKPFLSKADLVDVVSRRLADPGLTRELDILAGDTTDDLP